MKPLLHFSFLLMPHFNMIAFTNAVEVLRVANQLGKTNQYTWRLVSLDGGDVAASNGIALETVAISEVEKIDIVFVCGGNDIHEVTTAEHLALLRRLDRSGILLGGICTGAYALAKAGLLSGYECSIHWERLFAHQETFRKAKFSKRLFVIDRDRVTCAGGVAPLHMMLDLIAPHVGQRLISEITDYFIVEHLRNTNSLQAMPLVARLGSANRVVFDVVEMMESNIDEPLSGDEFARRTKMSNRQLQRLFRETLGTSMAKYYVQLRLKRARELLLQTDMPLQDIITACGFQSTSHFSKSYHQEFGHPPSEERKRVRG
ncbi:GlxA family transcriptional regulator [Paraburkholderia sp. A1RI-2L]|uniref:GlxA family transcriptional regulator n=1 Tax=Paraburkholderia sp. A1RI-2L TaxID=3028367 RepID=UPI003B77D813